MICQFQGGRLMKRLNLIIFLVLSNALSTHQAEAMMKRAANFDDSDVGYDSLHDQIRTFINFYSAEFTSIPELHEWKSRIFESSSEVSSAACCTPQFDNIQDILTKLKKLENCYKKADLSPLVTFIFTFQLFIERCGKKALETKEELLAVQVALKKSRQGVINEPA